MKIAQLTTDLEGGAGVAAKRINESLRETMIESTLFYKNSETIQPPYSIQVSSNSSLDRIRSVVLGRNEHRAWSSDGFVTRLKGQGYLFDPKYLLNQYHVINLHWISRWFDLRKFFDGINSSTPIIWSLHDLNPATGGCHHPRDCSKYTSDCSECPQVKSIFSQRIVQSDFEQKKKIYSGLNLHIVGNSRWTTEQAKKSQLLSVARSFQTIHLGVNCNEFTPIEKGICKRSLQVNKYDMVVGFGCADLSDQNKGLDRVICALNQICKKKSICLLLFGEGHVPVSDYQFDIQHLGKLSSNPVKSLVYSACDVFVLASLFESFGQTALEASACGTPVLAYKTSGVIDIIDHLITGILEPKVGDVDKVASHLLWFMEHKKERLIMGGRARARVLEKFSHLEMAKNYKELYTNLANETV